MTPQEAIKMLENVHKEGDAGQIVRACNMISAETPKWVLQLMKKFQQMLDVRDKKIVALLQKMARGGAAPAPVEETDPETVEGDATPVPGPGERVSNTGSGRILTAEQAEIEDAMDAAVAAEEAEKRANGGKAAEEEEEEEPAAASAPAAKAPVKASAKNGPANAKI